MRCSICDTVTTSEECSPVCAALAWESRTQMAALRQAQLSGETSAVNLEKWGVKFVARKCRQRLAHVAGKPFAEPEPRLPGEIASETEFALLELRSKGAA